MASEESSDDCQNGLIDNPKIIIIGAGISGIAAGSYLTSSGFTDFVILEATERVGGRIHSIDLETANDVKAELGANWIHGIDKNPIFTIAKQHKLLDEPVKGRSLGESLKFLKEDGSPVNTKIVEEVDWTYGMLMSQVEDFYQSNIPTPVENDSVGAFVERGFEMKADQKRHQGPDRKLRRMILEQRMLGEAVINGCHDLHDLALSEAGSFEELPGVHYVIRPGFEEVIRILKRNIPSGNILLSHPVTQVKWDIDNQGAQRYEACVECQNGKKFYANHVLVTCSLGYLKKCSGRLFSPPLPNFKLDAMNRLCIGTVNKIILEFESRVLPSGVSRLELIWDRTNVENMNVNDAWIRKIGSFDAIAETVVVGWLSGREAEFIETLTEEEVGEKCVETIKQVLKTTDIPKLKRVVMSKWKSHPYTLGSYSFIPIGATAEDVDTMGEPVTGTNSDKPVLLFAGEATHPTFYSSSHGALLSGQREAQRIVDLYHHHDQ